MLGNIAPTVFFETLQTVFSITPIIILTQFTG